MTKDNINLIHGDCMEYMRSLPDKALDLAVVDPPYNLPKDSCNGRGKLKDRVFNKGNIKTWDIAPMAEYFKELFRVSCNQIIWGGNYFDLPPTRGIICWDKCQPWTNFSQWEMAWTSFNKPAALFKYDNRTGGKIHPTQKPVALYKWLLERYAKEGDKILDTHLGSGSSAIAAWDKELPLDALWEQWKRIVKPNGAIVLFGQGLFSAKLMMSQPKMYRYSLVWDKGRTTGFLNANRAPLRQHEDILVFYRQQPTYNPQKRIVEPHLRTHSRNSKSAPNSNSCYGNFKQLSQDGTSCEKFPTSILHFQKKHKDWYHPTEKDVSLLEYLIRTYTNEGDCVLDCVMGSGSTMVACSNTGRRGIGIELMQEYYDIAVKRVWDAQA